MLARVHLRDLGARGRPEAADGDDLGLATASRPVGLGDVMFASADGRIWIVRRVRQRPRRVFEGSTRARGRAGRLLGGVGRGQRSRRRTPARTATARLRGRRPRRVVPRLLHRAALPEGLWSPLPAGGAVPPHAMQAPCTTRLQGTVGRRWGHCAPSGWETVGNRWETRSARSAETSADEAPILCIAERRVTRQVNSGSRGSRPRRAGHVPNGHLVGAMPVRRP